MPCQGLMFSNVLGREQNCHILGQIIKKLCQFIKNGGGRAAPVKSTYENII